MLYNLQYILLSIATKCLDNKIQGIQYHKEGNNQGELTGGWSLSQFAGEPLLVDLVDLSLPLVIGFVVVDCLLLRDWIRRWQHCCSGFVVGSVAVELDSLLAALFLQSPANSRAFLLFYFTSVSPVVHRRCFVGDRLSFVCSFVN